MLRLAGCSSGTGVCARGGCPARRCVSLAAFCVRHRPALRSCRGALRSASPSLAFLSRRFALVSRLLFAAMRQTGRLAVSCVPVPPGRDRHSCVLVMSARLSAFAGSLRVWPFLCGDLDGVAGGRGERGVRRTGLRGWRRGACASLRGHIGLEILSAGSTLGLRAPNLRQRAIGSLDSLHGADRMAKCALHGGVMSVRIRGDSARPAASYAAPPSYREFAPACAAQACS